MDKVIDGDACASRMLVPTPEEAASPRIITLGDGLSLFGRGSNGKAVLLIHGITGSPVEMKYLAKGLHKAGYTVYAPLLSGHGVDVSLLRKTTWEDWYRGAYAAAQWLSLQSTQVFVSGVCVGGMLGLKLAKDMPAIRGAAIYSPLFDYDGWNAPFYYRLGRISVPIAMSLGVAKYIVLRERHPFGIKSDRIRRLLTGSGDGIRGTLPAYPPETLYQNYRLFDWIKAALPDIRTPTLVVHSTQDDLSNPRNAQYLADRIGARCDVAWLHNSYHMIHVDQEHSTVVERTRAFFDALAHA